MFKLGIVGAENSHSYQIAKLCNIKKAVPIRVPVIWGETAKFAKYSAEVGEIPAIVKDWRDMLGQVDGVMIDHRHPGPHYEVAEFFVQNKVPTFVDKPFTWKLSDAKKLLDLADKKKCPIVTFSAIPIQPPFKAFKKALAKSGTLRALNVTGPVDMKSKYGGVFFYGIHQVDSIIDLLGVEVKSVFVHKGKPNGVATFMYKDGTVATMNCIKEGGGGFYWTACTDKGIVTYNGERDPDPYIPSVKLIQSFLKSKKNPFPRERMLAPIAVLAAMQKSLDTGKPVNVAKF